MHLVAKFIQEERAENVKMGQLWGVSMWISYWWRKCGPCRKRTSGSERRSGAGACNGTTMTTVRMWRATRRRRWGIRGMHSSRAGLERAEGTDGVFIVKYPVYSALHTLNRRFSLQSRTFIVGEFIVKYPIEFEFHPSSVNGLDLPHRRALL